MAADSGSTSSERKWRAVVLAGLALLLSALAQKRTERRASESACRSSLCTKVNHASQQPSSPGTSPTWRDPGKAIFIPTFLLLLLSLYLFGQQTTSFVPVLLLFADGVVALGCAQLLTTSSGSQDFLRELASALFAGVAVAIVLLPSQRQASSDAEHRASRSATQFALADPELSGIDLSGRELFELTLFRKDLSDARFRDSLMEGVIFDQGSLVGAAFEGAQVVGSSFIGVAAEDVSFGCDFTNESTVACENPTELTGVEFRDGVVLQNAKFHHASIDDVLFDQVDLRRARFQGVVARSVNFDHVDLRGTNFAAASFDSTVTFGSACWDDTTTWPGDYSQRPTFNARACL